VQRVYAHTMTVNVASRPVMEKSGLRFKRTFWQPWPDQMPGPDEGEVEYALLRPEWEQGSDRRLVPAFAVHEKACAQSSFVLTGDSNMCLI
jgi:hypothetical protein